MQSNFLNSTFTHSINSHVWSTVHQNNLSLSSHIHCGKANTLLKIQIKVLNFSSNFSEDIWIPSLHITFDSLYRRYHWPLIQHSIGPTNRPIRKTEYAVRQLTLQMTTDFCDFVQMQVCYEIMTPYSCYGQHFLYSSPYVKSTLHNNLTPLMVSSWWC